MIKRYDFAVGCNPCAPVEMAEEADGCYVTYEDHAAEVERVKEECLAAMKCLTVEHKETVAALVCALEELVAVSETLSYSCPEIDSAPAALALAKGGGA